MSVSINSERPKILMLCGSLGAGGKERQLINLLRYLQQTERYSVFSAVMNPGGIREQEAAQFSDEIIPVSRWFAPDIITPIIKLRRLIQKNHIKVIHTWGSGVWDLVGMILSKLCHIPVIHGGIRSAPSSLKLGNQLSRWSAKHADVVVANSWAGLNAFNLRDLPNAQVIYNGVEISHFNLPAGESEPKSLCMVSNFRSEKDHKTLILAMSEIISHFPESSLYLVGRDLGTLEEIRSFVQQLGLNEHVIFITDCLQPQKIIAKCQIGLLTTFGEGLSNVILEYMALSKPVIASNVGGNPEVVVHGVTGYLVPLKSPMELAKRVINLLNDPEKLNEMGKAGHGLVVERFTIDKMGLLYVEIYQSLIGQND